MNSAKTRTSDLDDLPLIMEPAHLARLLPNDRLLLIAVCSEQVFSSQHIPGSVLIQPAELVCGIPPATGKIPDEDRLSDLFSRVGLSEERHVIAYDDEGGGWAGRLIWTLDVLGHQNASYLNGGLVAWARAGYMVESQVTMVPRIDYRAHIDRSQIATREQVQAQIDDPESAVWDARGADEFAGEKITAQRNGHIPNAVNLDWLYLMDPDNDLRLQPLEEIRAHLNEVGITQDKKVITHCQTHHRSGLSYLVGKALGMDIRAYDGSWSEWGNLPDTPIES